MSTDATPDLHALEPEDFLEEVHSFQHWLDSVRGYLDETRYGHPPELPEEELAGRDRDRLITTLCTYAIGELTALEGSSGLIRIAPNQASKIFLSTQVVDEGRHLEVLLHRMRELGVRNPAAEVELRASSSIRVFRKRLLELVDSADWEAAIFAQNVVLEAMEFSVFNAHAKEADPITREVLERIIRDERRHMGFGENEVGRRIQSDPGVRRRLTELKAELDPLVLETFEHTLEEMGVAPSERPQVGRDYLRVAGRLGVA